MKDFWNDTTSITQTMWNEADTDLRFSLGDANLWNRFYSLYPNYAGRNGFQFNYCRRYINFISGQQRQLRKQSIVIPQEDGSQRTADQRSKVLQHVSHCHQDYNVISDAFEMAITSGIGWLHQWIDYRNDPINGNIITDALPFAAVISDPWARKPDLSDCNTIWYRKYMHKEEVLSLFPEQRAEIESVRPTTYRDDKFLFLQENFSLNKRLLYSLDEYCYADTRSAIMVIDTETGDNQEWRGEEDAEELRAILRGHPELVVKRMEKKTVKTALVLNMQYVLYDGYSPYGIDRYNFQPLYCYNQPDSNLYSLKQAGIVRMLRDAQYLYNRRKQIELDMLESVATTGYAVIEGSLVDDTSVFNTGQGRAMFVKKNAPAGLDSIRQLDQAVVAPTTIQLSQMLTQDMAQIVGLSDESMGLNMDDKAAIIANLRQLSTQVALQKIFDNLDYAQHLHSEVKMEMILANYSPGKIRSILGEEPEPDFFLEGVSKYKVAIVNGTDTPTQKQMTALQLYRLQELGYQIPPENLLATVDVQNKEQLTKALTDQREMQNQMQQLDLQLKQLEIQGKLQAMEAKAFADKSLGVERLARVEENRALAIDRIAEAQAARDRGTLDKIKAAKELTGIDLEHINHALQILQQVSQMQQIEEQQGAAGAERQSQSQQLTEQLSGQMQKAV
jgi:hypothetical protein